MPSDGSGLFISSSRSAKGACGKRAIDETVTDVHSAIASLPPRYFQRKTAKIRGALCETVSGMRTIVGQIRRQKVESGSRRVLSLTLAVLSVVFLFLLALAAFLAWRSLAA